MRCFLSFLLLLGLTGTVWAQPTLRELRPVPGHWTIAPERCLEATYEGNLLRLYLWPEGLEIWQARQQLAQHPCPRGVRYPSQSLVATYVDPKRQTIPMLVLSDSNDTTVMVFAKGWNGALFQQTFSHAASESTYLKTDVDRRGFHRFTRSYRNPREPGKNFDTVYLWNGSGFAEKR